MINSGDSRIHPDLCLSNAEMRALDEFAIQTLKVPGIQLMEEAGTGAAEGILEIARERQIGDCTVFCGGGNNGGDGFVIAKYLFEKGLRVRAVCTTAEGDLKGDALHWYHEMRAAGVSCKHIERADELRQELDKHSLWVDALLGTGLNDPLRGLLKEVLEILAEERGDRPVCAVDIPSGISGTTGLGMGPVVRADTTFTMGAYKTGLFLEGSRQYCGDIRVIPLSYPAEAFHVIGISTQLVRDKTVRERIRPLRADTHKYLQGQLCIVGGSSGMPGAVSMAGEAALRGGCGMVRIFNDPAAHSAVSARMPEIILHALDPDSGPGIWSADLKPYLDRTRAWLVGPGLGRDTYTAEFVKFCLKHLPGPLVLDADALFHIDDPERFKLRKGPTAITPHAGEFSRLFRVTTDEIHRSGPELARRFSMQYGIVIHLKGAGSVTAVPDGRLFIHSTGNPGMGTAGSGDVLAGLTASFAAQGHSIEDSAVIGAHIHGRAGDLAAENIGIRGMTATDIIRFLPAALKPFEIIGIKTSDLKKSTESL